MLDFDLFLWLEHGICTKDLIAFCREKYNGHGVIAVSYLKYLHLETGPTGDDRQLFFLTDCPCTSIGEYTGSELIVQLLIFLMWLIYPSVVIGCEML